MPQSCLLHLPGDLGKAAAYCLRFLISGMSPAPIRLRGRGTAQGMRRHLAALPQLPEGISMSHCCRAVSEHSPSRLDASPSRCSRSDGWPSCPGCPCSAPRLICQSSLTLSFLCSPCKQRPTQERASLPSEGLEHGDPAPDACCSITPSRAAASACTYVVQMLGSCPRGWQRVACPSWSPGD